MISVTKWHPNFDPYDTHVSKVLAWVRFPCIPIEYYNGSMLLKLGNLVGKALYADNTSLTANMGKFAQVCVDIDLSKPLLAKF